MKNKVTVSVPGKIHLMGEHAVVYGKPALLAAINLRLKVSIEPADTFTIISTEPTDYVRYAAEYLVKEYKLAALPNVKITITSDIPAGYHLGSSAAVAVGTVGALMYYLKKIWNPQLINQFAYEVEKKQHGNPSGGDNTTVTMGGFIWFRKELEFLKSIWQLPFKPAKNLNHFFLINTGRPKENTGEMVALVKGKVQQEPEEMQKLLFRNEQQVKRVTVALKEGDEQELIDAIRVGEHTLEGMGVVSMKVQPLMREIESAGGAVKILGGGGVSDGVGFLLCYHHDKDIVEKLCQKYRYTTLSVRLGEEGIRLEEKE